MTIERPMFPPVNSARRTFLTQAAGIAAGGALLGASLPLPAPAATLEQTLDPIFAAIERHRAAGVGADEARKTRAKFDDIQMDEARAIECARLQAMADAADEACQDAGLDMLTTVPTTGRGLVAMIRYARSQYANYAEHMPRGEMEDEDGAEIGGWSECLLDTLAEAVEALSPRGLA